MEAHQLNEVQLSNKLESSAAALHRPASALTAERRVPQRTLRLLELEGSFAWRASAAAISLDLGLAQIGVLSFWLLLVLALFGLRTQAIRRVPRWFWGVPLVMWITVVLVNAETPRFREPLDPFLLLLAACAIGAAWQRLQGGAGSSEASAWPRADPPSP